MTKDVQPYKHVYCRIVGHVLTAYLQTTYFMEMRIKMDDALLTHPELQVFDSLFTRYLTMWNLLFQVVYAFVGLICDVSTALEMESVVPTWFRRHRFTFYYGLIIPYSMNAIPFWVLFLYDRSLVLPEHLDIVVSPTCNFLWHGAILIYSFWELAFLPKDTPDTSASWNLIVATTSGFTILFFYTRYVDLGIWPYDVLNKLEGTTFLYLLIASIPSFMISTYFIQFYVKDFIWQLREKKRLSADFKNNVIKQK